MMQGCYQYKDAAEMNAVRESTRVFEARALRQFKGNGVRANNTIYVSKRPNGQFYLSKSGTVGTFIQGRVFCTDAVENVDFERV
jgi:hypothetical protein